MTLSKTTALVFVALTLGACTQTTGSIIPSNTLLFKKQKPASPHDGRWIGRYTITQGDPQCPQRGVLNMQIQNGEVYAKTTMKRYVSRWQGDIMGDTVVGQTERKDAVSGTGTFNGTFTKTYAKGTWKSKACHGTWDANRVQ